MKITKRELHRLLGEAKKKPKVDDATQKTRPDGYADLPTFMTPGRQSPTKYSGYGAQLGAGVIDDPAVADPEGDNIDADALRVVRQLQARGAGQKEDKKKKLKEGVMSVTRNDIRRLVNEALDEMSMMGDEDLDEMTDDAYNDDLQSRHGRFTTPGDVKGTAQHRAAHGPYVSDRRGAPSTPMGPASAEELERIRARRGDSLANLPLNPYDGPNSPDSAYYDLREGDFPEELEGIYGEELPDFGKRGSRDDSFMDYDPEEIPDMDDQYDPEYYEGLDDEEDDDSFMDYETGPDDVPYGAADVALRMGRGYRTDEGDDLYEGDSQGDDDTPDGDDADYDTGSRSRFPSARGGINEGRWALLAGILKG